MITPVSRSHDYAPVLIVGGGLIGLSASLFLAHSGIPSLLVERHSETSTHPKILGLNVRGMELLRSVGIEDAVHAAGNDRGQCKDFVLVSTLAQGELARQPLPGTSEEKIWQLSPTSTGYCSQDKLEPVLLKAAQQAGGQLHFSTELLSFEQDATGITVLLLDRTTGVQRRMRTSYLIAADGVHSPVRHALSIAMSGRSEGHNASIYFQADLNFPDQQQSFAVCQVTHPEAYGFLCSINNRDLWTFHVSYAPEQGETLESFTVERCRRLIRQAVGRADLEVEVKSVLSWEAASRVVERFSSGRVFLAGDAAHQMPPSGGFGASTGIEDAHNLAWKLALVLRKQAHPVLLHTYDSERRPAVQFTVEQAGLRWKEGMSYYAADAAQKKAPGIVDDLVVTLGYRYASQAIISPQEITSSSEYTDLVLDGSPGTRTPHCWIERQGRRISTLDLLTRNFVLLTGMDGQHWCNAAHMAAARLKITIDTYCIGPGGDLVDDLPGCYLTALGIQSNGAVLVRPDGFVAWRSRGSDGPPLQTLEPILSHILCWASHCPV